MINENKLKIIFGVLYISLVTAFLLIFFNYFSFDDFSSYELIKNNRDKLNLIKNSNLFISGLFFLLGSLIWVLLLGFATPVYLIGGFIFGKWIGTLIVVLGLSSGAVILYLIGNFFFNDLIEKKFSLKYANLTNKFKSNEFLYFVIYRAVGGIPFFIQNLLPILFKVKVKNYFFGSILGLAPQLFVGTSLGAGLNKIIENNLTPPSIMEIIFSPDIYIPIMGIIILFVLSLLLRKKFFK